MAINNNIHKLDTSFQRKKKAKEANSQMVF